MKKLTIAEKALAYDEALEKAKAIYHQGSYKPDTAATIAEILQNVFPELQESEDEHIRKEIISALKYANHKGVYDKHIAWLEKQGDKSQGKSAFEAIKEEKVDNSNKAEPKDYSSVDPLFFKTTDKGKERR